MAHTINGKMEQLQSVASPNLRVAEYHSNTVVAGLSAGADNLSNATTMKIGAGYLYSFNGTTWDRLRSNIEATLLASAARTAQADSADQVNYNGSGLIAVVNVTVDPATAAITPTIQLKDSISSGYFTIWTAAAAISATGTYVYLFQPGGAAGSYTEAVNLRIPRTWRLRVTVADADSMTYSASAVMLV